MLNVTGLDHIVLNVADVERTVVFYRDVVGCGIERLEAWRGGQVPFPSVRLDAGTLIDLVQVKEGVTAAERGQRLNHICLVTGDDALEPAIAHLAAHGVPVTTGPARRWGAHGNGASIYFHDPDGLEVELRTYAPAALGRLEQNTAARSG